MCGTSFVGSGDPQKLIQIDTQGSVTHIIKLLNFVDVSGLGTYCAANQLLGSYHLQKEYRTHVK